MIGFAHSLTPVGFRAISMSFLSILSQKTYPGEALRPKGYFDVVCSIWMGPHPIINLPLFKNAIKSEPLRVRD